MKFTYKTIGAGLAALALAAAPTAVLAADCPTGFPSKPIQFLVGYGAGGGTDAIARAIAADIEQRQGWTLIVDNRPGAGGGVMSASLMTLPADGYAIGVGATGTVALNPYLGKDTPYTYETFDYLGSAMQINYGLVSLAEKPYATLEEFIEYARENGSATIATGGRSQEILIDQLSKHYKVDLIAVPNKGSAAALQSALGGHVDATTQGTQHVQQIKAGTMNQLASLVGNRVPYAPDSPTLVELGLDATIEGQTIFMIPKGADQSILTCLEGALDEAVNSEVYLELMRRLENEPQNLGADGATEVIAKSANFYKGYLGIE